MRQSIWVALVASFLSFLTPLRAAQIKGVVLAPDHSSAKNIDVYLLPDDPNNSGPVDPLMAKTDDRGTFHFDDSTGPAYLVAAGNGWGIATGSEDTDEFIHLQMPLPVDLTVRFLDPAGKPAANMAVQVSMIRGLDPAEGSFATIPWLAHPPLAEKTDANGEAKFTGLPQETVVAFAVHDDRYAQLNYQDHVQLARKPRQEAFIQLQPAASISGKLIFESTGKPAAGVRIGAQSQESWGSAVADGNGVYHLRQLRAGSYNIALDLDRTPDLAKSWTARAVEGLEISAGENKNGVDLILIHGAVLSGKALAEGTGQPISDVSIGVYGPAHPKSGAWVQGAFTLADGSFSLRVPPGEQYIYISSGDPPTGYRMPDKKDATITIQDGQNAHVEFRFAKILAFLYLKGKIIDEEGHPIAGAIIQAASSDRASFPRYLKSEADGSFQIESPPRGRTTQLRASFGDLATKTIMLLHSGESGQITLTVEKNAFASIVGQVVDGKGRPLPGAKIDLMESNEWAGWRRNLDLTDEEGKFKIDHLFPDGNYNIIAQLQGYGISADGNGWLRLKPGQTLTTANLVLKKRDASIAGVLLDDDGNPISGATIYVIENFLGTDTLRTDKSGKFHDNVVSGEKITVSASLNDGRSIIKAAKPGDQHILLNPMFDAN